MYYERFKSNMFYLIIAILLPLGNMVITKLGVSQNFIEVSYMYLFILVPSVIYILVSNKSFKKVLRLNSVNIKQLAISAFILLALQPITAVAANIMSTLIGNGYNSMATMSGGGNEVSLFMSIFMIAITPAICEEVVMRGIVLNGYRGIPLWKVAIMNGVLFGLFHNDFIQLSYTMVVGIVLTYVVVITDSILPAMLMHFMMNGLSVFIERYPSNIISKFIYWYESTALILVILAAISIVVIILLIKWLKIISINNSTQAIDDKLVEQDNKHDVTFVEWPLMMACIISIVYSVYK
ncbi:type II CAAX endopeptidase family protein [Clostridiaceae bacterium M8S5]|nr:type II CAAX endopeptidase family protein [Clostridiaceae bacterium M8S5]